MSALDNSYFKMESCVPHQISFKTSQQKQTYFVLEHWKLL